MTKAIDWNVISSLTEEVGEDAAKRLIKIFDDECTRTCEELAEYAALGNLRQVEVIAHRFKSSSRQFGAAALADVCRQLEEAAANGNDINKFLVMVIGASSEVRDMIATLDGLD